MSWIAVYKWHLEIEVAQAMVLEGIGAIAFDHRSTHSGMAQVAHTHEGVKAMD